MHKSVDKSIGGFLGPCTSIQYVHKSGDILFYAFGTNIAFCKYCAGRKDV